MNNIGLRFVGESDYINERQAGQCDRKPIKVENAAEVSNSQARQKGN